MSNVPSWKTVESCLACSITCIKGKCKLHKYHLQRLHVKELDWVYSVPSNAGVLFIKPASEVTGFVSQGAEAN